MINQPSCTQPSIWRIYGLPKLIEFVSRKSPGSTKRDFFIPSGLIFSLVELINRINCLILANDSVNMLKNLYWTLLMSLLISILLKDFKSFSYSLRCSVLANVQYRLLDIFLFLHTIVHPLITALILLSSANLH